MKWQEQNELAAIALAKGRTNARGKVRVNCPFCEDRTGKPDKKTSLAGNVNSGRYHCYKCAASGRFAESLNLDAREEDGIKTFPIPEWFIPLTSGALVTQPARNYALRRGIREELFDELQIGCCVGFPYAQSLVVPVLLDDGAWAGYVCRRYVNFGRPYNYPEDMDKGKVLYNSCALWVQTDEPVLVVEGVLDVMSVFPDAVALLGSESYEQREMLAAARRPVCVVLDGDAWEHGWSLALWLRLQGQRAGSIRLNPRKDPDEVNPEWLRKEARKSIQQPLSER